MPSTNSIVLSPAIDSFAELNLLTTIHDALERMNITTPTRIQAETLPILLEGRDVIGQSRTGSGKTLAFGIPAIEIVDPALRAVQVLILTPTRELAVQVGDVLADLAKGTGIRTVLVYGGRAMGPQKDALRRGAQIVVGTPGRVADLYGQGALRLDSVRFLVLDEADEMLDRGFAPQVNQILSWTPRERQTALFSATMPDWVNQASHKHLRNPEHVSVAPTTSEQTQIDHVAYDVPAGGKMDALKDLLDARGDGQVIVFGRTKHGVKKLAKQLMAAGYPVAALQGNMSQNARDQVMADFRAGKISILLATNVAARGIDVTAVDHVINFELPESSELLQHRIGRTGRMGRAGSAITLLGAEDADKWRQLMRGLGKQITRQPWTGPHRTDRAPRVAHAAQNTPAPAERRPRPEQSNSNGAVATSPNGRDRANGRRSGDSRRPGGRDGNQPESRSTTSRNERNRRSNRSDQQRSNPAPAQRSSSSISVVSDMIRERRGQPEPRDRSAQTSNGNGRALRGSFQFDELIDQEKFAPRNRGVSRDSDRRAERSYPALNPTGRPSFPSREERPQESASEPNGKHTATCSNCGGTATLRFAPDLSRPVFCDACFSERRKSRRPRAN